MVAPDIELICEIMLVAEGFVDARSLARKFITLYALCRELLSKQVRRSLVTFSWFLHPIKTAFGIWVLGDLLFKFLLDTGIILYFPYTFENL